MKNLFSFFLLLIVLQCPAQNTDSLKKIVNGNQTTQKRLKASVALSDYFSSKNAEETFSAAKTGLVLADKLNDNKAIGKLYKSIGKAWFLKGKYDSTGYYLNQSAGILEKTKDEAELADANHEFGKLYAKTKDYKKAIEFYEKVIDYCQKADSKLLQMNTLNQLGNAYEADKNYPEALRCFKEAVDIKEILDIAKKIKDSVSVSYSLDFIGDVLGSMKWKEESEEYLLKTLEDRKALHDTLAMTINYFNLGVLYKEKKQYPKSLEALQLCLQYSTKIRYGELQNSATNELADLYERMGDFKQSLVYYKKYKDLNDAVFNDKSSRDIAELQTKYATTQREKQIQEQQFEISKRNYWVAGISVILFLSLMLSYSSFKRSQLKQQNTATQAIIETEEKERKRIAQDLHDSVSQTMSAAKMNLVVIGNELQFKNDEQRRKFEKAITLVDNGFKEVRTISHNMMPVALLETGLAVVIKQFIQNIESDEMAINFFTRGFEDHFDATIETILYRVLQECIHNVMKHAHANSLDISLIRDEGSISLTIEDNGKGFDMTNPDRYQGMGLKNMQTRISFLKGKIEFDSHPGKGTLVSVYIPLANKNL